MSARHLYDGQEAERYCGEQLIPGAAGFIEALVKYPADYRTGRPIAVVCHPHPLYGGSMANKVVHILASTLVDIGLPVLRFNFRGVGKSEGHFDHGHGECDDLLTVIDWFAQRNGQAPVWLAGFSFGAFVAARAHVEANVERLLLVAPPVSLFDFRLAGELHVPTLVIQGGRDAVIDAQAVRLWTAAQRTRPALHWMEDADHFFHGKLNQLRDLVQAEWGE